MGWGRGPGLQPELQLGHTQATNLDTHSLALAEFSFGHMPLPHYWEASLGCITPCPVHTARRQPTHPPTHLPPTASPGGTQAPWQPAAPARARGPAAAAPCAAPSLQEAHQGQAGRESARVECKEEGERQGTRAPRPCTSDRVGRVGVGVGATGRDGGWYRGSWDRRGGVGGANSGGSSSSSVAEEAAAAARQCRAAQHPPHTPVMLPSLSIASSTNSCRSAPCSASAGGGRVQGGRAAAAQRVVKTHRPSTTLVSSPRPPKTVANPITPLTHAWRVQVVEPQHVQLQGQGLEVEHSTHQGGALDLGQGLARRRAGGQGRVW